MSASLEDARRGVRECRAALHHATEVLSRAATDGCGRVRTDRLDDLGPEAFDLARHLSQVGAAEAVLDWADGRGPIESGLATHWCAQATSDLAAWIAVRFPDAPCLDLSWVRNAQAAAPSLGARLVERRDGGDPGLPLSHVAIREAMARFATERIEPVADDIHRRDLVVPETLLRELMDLGVFGLSVPEEYGGTFTDTLAMLVATEELSRASLGAGGSVITRPEICARALLRGGSEDQKRRWLPRVASGETMVSVAVTEPDAGSDVAALRTMAVPAPGGYRIRGEKTWCTFAGRADVLLLLARTGGPGHAGLSLFLVEKPATAAGSSDDEAFAHDQPDGGSMSGRAIPTVGYRGMHSFAVSFDDWFVPAGARIGAEGDGFRIVMDGFAGGRIQTAARAVGVMEAALRDALRYVAERRAFGRALCELPLVAARVADMAARVQAARQLAWRVAARIDGLDDGDGSSRTGTDAALAKLLASREAERVTREAMQLHGGMGYSEEYRVSRFWLDARVLSIFEGAEDVLAVRVIARQALAELAISGRVG